MNGACGNEGKTWFQKYVQNWYFGITLTFRKAAILDVITDSTLVLHTDQKIRLMEPTMNKN